MLATAEIVRTVHQSVATADFPLVVDPVMVATSGDHLLDEAGERAYEDLLEEAPLVTPNYDETLVLTGIDPRNGDAARDAGQRLVEMGADAALVKGGHADGDTVTDVRCCDLSKYCPQWPTFSRNGDRNRRHCWCGYAQ